jgi:hypothetical protein
MAIINKLDRKPRRKKKYAHSSHLIPFGTPFRLKSKIAFAIIKSEAKKDGLRRVT